TAGNVKGEREKCLEAGMDDFVVKPVVEATVEILLNKWLNPDPTDLHSKEAEKVLELNSHYDPSKLKDYTDNDEEFLENILTIVKSELQSSLLSIEEKIQAEDLKKSKETGHKLYGTAISSGMQTLS